MVRRYEADHDMRIKTIYLYAKFRGACLEDLYAMK